MKVDATGIHKLSFEKRLLLTPIRKSYFNYSKRLIDVAIVCFSLPILMPIFAIISVAIKLESKGAIIFKQKRIGQYGREFTCFKFRSMVSGADTFKTTRGPLVTNRNDHRITFIGSILRKTNLDELPQLINVLIGDMSLVGPRPYPTKEHWHWAGLIPGFHARTLVLPGISGLAQVRGQRGGTLQLDEMQKRFESDLDYVRNYSLMNDLRVIYHTIMQTLKLDTGAH